jgi:hypothetical protein
MWGLLKVLSAIVGPTVLVLCLGYLWDEGYLGFYWDRYDSIYDPKLNVTRCIDDNGELSQALSPPCAVVNSRGMKARERWAKRCEESGRDSESCTAESYQWLYSTEPKPN